MANEKETVARAPRGRVTRTPLGARNRLGAKNKDPNFEYRFVNDEGDRIDAFMQAGWVPADGNEDVGVSRLNVPTQEGSVKSVAVGNGVRGVLMKIQKDWYAEDQKAKQEHINEKESGIFRVKTEDGQYGEIKSKTRSYG